mgnify:CR=1 FL=1
MKINYTRTHLVTIRGVYEAQYMEDARRIAETVLQGNEDGYSLVSSTLLADSHTYQPLSDDNPTQVTLLKPKPAEGSK